MKSDMACRGGRAQRAHGSARRGRLGAQERGGVRSQVSRDVLLTKWLFTGRK